MLYQKTSVVPLRKFSWIKIIYKWCILVVGKSEIEGFDNNKYKPYENTGIEEGRYDNTSK